MAWCAGVLSGNRSCSYTDQAGEHDVRAGGRRVAELTLVGRRRLLSLGKTDYHADQQKKTPPPATRLTVHHRSKASAAVLLSVAAAASGAFDLSVTLHHGRS